MTKYVVTLGVTMNAETIDEAWDVAQELIILLKTHASVDQAEMEGDVGLEDEDDDEDLDDEDDDDEDEDEDDDDQ